MAASSPFHDEEESALQERTVLHLQRGDWAEVMDLVHHWIKRHPDSAEAHGYRGCALRHLARFSEALESLDRMIQLQPDSAQAHHNRGVVLRDLGRLDEALACHERALEIDARYVQAWRNRGIVQHELGQGEAALASYERAIELCPGDAQAFLLRGNGLHRLRRFEEAVASFAQAIALRPDFAEAHYHSSLSWLELLQLTVAIQCCERAIEIRPQYAEAQWHLAQMRILEGDYERGWTQFDWRWRSASYGKTLRTFDPPLWSGAEALQGKTLLVTRDGGFGDTLQFCRYAPLLVEAGAHVVLEVQPGLVTLLRESLPEVQIMANGEVLPPFDFHCPLMNLPGASALSLEQIPNRIPYLKAPLTKVAEWAARLGASTRPRIGLVWSGSTDHSNDFKRSMRLEQMSGLFSLEAEFHCLQKIIRDQDLEAIRRLPIQTWEEELADFADTAGLTMSMDLVISVDTSVAHLAGALGKWVWVLLPYVPDMRWLLDRDDSPWYPEVMRLFRQSSRGEWPMVLARVREELQGFLQRQTF